LPEARKGKYPPPPPTTLSTRFRAIFVYVLEYHCYTVV
jgi:hypothetical protein